MLRTSTVPKIAALCLLAAASLAHAQQTPSSAPPKLERIEEGSDTPITVTPPKNQKKVTEKRENGQTKEVTVSTGKSTYTMTGKSPTAVAQPGNSGGLNPPQWKVMEFDLGKKKKNTEAPEEAASPASVPPPPPAK